MVQFVDWDLAATTAGTLSRSGPKVSYAEAAGVVAQLRQFTDVAEGHVRDFTTLRPQVSHPPVRVVDRPDWAAVNLAGLDKMFTPLVTRLTQGREPGPIAQMVGSRVAGVQAGSVLAYLAGRVLGQYEVFSTDPGQLMLVAPNIVDVERKLDADPADFRLWVCLHEVTHRTQFTAVPWLRQYLFDQVEAFVNATHLDSDQMADRLRRAVEAIAGSIRDPNRRVNVLELVQTPAQREVLDRLTAMMTLLEGHAEFVMDGVGPTVVPSVEEIRAKFNQRRQTANPIERVIRKLLGVDVKLRQYAEGRRFVHAVVDQVGMADFNRIWESPQTLPKTAELSDPRAWVSRVVNGRAAAEPTAPTASAAETTGEPGEPTDNPKPAARTVKKVAKKTVKKAVKKPAKPSDADAKRPSRPRKAAPPPPPEPPKPAEG
jgi:coenzyme F420 biosynthesis associated uncharacterized protein